MTLEHLHSAGREPDRSKEGNEQQKQQGPAEDGQGWAPGRRLPSATGVGDQPSRAKWVGGVWEERRRKGVLHLCIWGRSDKARATRPGTSQSGSRTPAVLFSSHVLPARGSTEPGPRQTS